MRAYLVRNKVEPHHGIHPSIYVNALTLPETRRTSGVTSRIGYESALALPERGGIS